MTQPYPPHPEIVAAIEGDALGELVTLTEWRALGADLVRTLRHQQAQKVSVMATESRHMDLAKERSAAFESLIARAEALLK